MAALPARRALLPFLVLAVAAFAALAPTTATAKSVTQRTAQACDTYANGTDWFSANADLQLPKFNPALGTLVDVEVTQGATITSTMKVESRNAAPRTDTFQLDTGTVWIQAPGTSRVTAGLPSQTKTHSFTAYDGTADFAGTSGWSSSFGDDSQSAITHLGNAAAWSGAGSVAIDAEAVAATRNSMSGNYVLDWATSATVSACVTYTYAEEVLVCIGDYVWFDADRDGVQDVGETGVAGRPITVVDANGAVLGSTTTDASGRWLVCGLEPSTVCVVQVDLPDGYSLSPTGQGGDATLDSNGVPRGTDAAIPCMTPQRDRDLTFDVGIWANPQVTETPGSSQAQPAVLRVAKRAVTPTVRAGATATFVVTVRNRASVAVADVTVCDTPPTQLAFKTRPRGSYFRNGRLCWNIASLGAGQARTFRYTMRAANVSRSLCVNNSVRAAASAGGAATSSARQCIRQVPQAVDAPLPLAG